jgi:hypothetical protein
MHRHRWARVCPISPTWDRRNRRARWIATNPRLTHYGCDCGAVKTVRLTTHWLYFAVSRPGPDGRRRTWASRRTLTGGSRSVRIADGG